MDYNELTHHGVKGMKWGVRRYLKNRSVAKTRKKALEKARATKEANKKLKEEKERMLKEGDAKQILKNKNKFTNEELQTAINRLQLEQKLSETSPKQVSAGKAFAKYVGREILTPAGTDIAKQLVKSGMAYGVNKTFNLKGESRVYANNKKKS